MKKIIYLLGLLAGHVYVVHGQDARITVDASKVLNRVPNTMFGSCIEDVNHEIYGGIYAQRLYGESFEEPAPGHGYKGWTRLPGMWRIGDGGMPNGTGPGFKFVLNGLLVKDGVIEGDVLFADRGRSAGFLLRVQEPIGTAQVKPDCYSLNVYRGRKEVILTRGEMVVTGVLPAAVRDSAHLRVELVGGRIKAYVDGVGTPIIDHTDKDKPLLAGLVGIRSDNAAGEVRHVMVGGRSIGMVNASVPAVSAHWDAIERGGRGKFALDTVNAYTGRQAQVVNFLEGKGKVGVSNMGLNHWGIAVRADEVFDGSVFLRGSAGSVTVALESSDGLKTYASAVLKGIGRGWKKFSFSMRSGVEDRRARFVVYASKGKVWIDQASLMTGNTGPFKGLPLRGDIADMMVKEGLTFLRYGGTMVNSPAYRWRHMIDNRDERPPYKGHWYPYSSNGFGIEELVNFAERAGFEAAFAINVEERPEDAADMVEYLTGDAASEWGRRRAAAGHPAPYKLHYIEIGNEEVIWGEAVADYDHYTERFNMLADAIHAKNPAINLVCSVWWRSNESNMQRVFRAINGKAAYWDIHTDADNPKAGVAVDARLQQVQDRFLAWDPQTKMRIAVFEENGGLHNMQRALGHASTLNAIRRHGDFVLTSCPANALQPYGENDNDWDQGQIFFTPSQVWGMPPFYAQQMAAANYLPLRVADQSEGGLDVTATASEDGRLLVLHVVNASKMSVKTVIDLGRFNAGPLKGIAYTLAGKLSDENTPTEPERIRTVQTKVDLRGNGLDYSFQAHSYTILRFER